MSQLKRVQEAVERSGLGALLLMDDKNIYYATGFMPTDSAALITPSRAWLVTDSRYIEDAGAKCSPGVELVLDTAGRPLGECLKALAAEVSGEIGAEDDKLCYAAYTALEGRLGRVFSPGRRPGGRPARPQGRRRVGKPHRGAAHLRKGAGGDAGRNQARHERERAGRRADLPHDAPWRGEEQLRPHRHHRRAHQYAPRRPPAGRSSPAATSSPWTSAASRTATAPT